MTDPRIKLTLEQALDIRRRYEQRGPGGAGISSLAVQFGTTHGVIRRILTGEHPLVKGVPNISGTREGLAKAGRTDPMRGLSGSARRSLGDGRSPVRKTQQQHRQNPVPCPICGARRGEYCTNMIGGGYLRERKNVHDERRTP